MGCSSFDIEFAVKRFMEDIWLCSGITNHTVGVVGPTTVGDGSVLFFCHAL